MAPEADDRSLGELRRERSQIYRLLAAMHAGPLGFELAPLVTSCAEALFGVDDFPGTAPAPPAELHRWAYGHCAGNPELGCSASVVSECLPAKFLHLAASARKGASKRRLREATFIRDELVPCLETNLKHMEVAAYRDLMVLSRAVVEADEAHLREHPEAC